MSYLLDTDICVYFLRQHPIILERVHLDGVSMPISHLTETWDFHNQDLAGIMSGGCTY
jgi:hypothetical protein